jgi:altronate dehydratase large subunit
MRFMGYRRPDGRIGVRNHVVVVSTVFCSSTVTRAIAEATGAVPITHEAGCLELGPAREHTERVLRGVVSHPNVGAVLVVGLGCEQVSAESLVEAAGGKPSRALKIRKAGGTESARERGIELARELLLEAAGARRVPADPGELTLATQCGSSDTGSGLASNPVVGIVADKLVALGGVVLLGETGSLYGAAGLMARRAVSREVAQRIVEITDVVERYYARMGKSLTEANPTPGNIAAGLTTLVEKSLGGVRKGGTTPIQGVLGPAEPVPPGSKGLWIMDTSLGLGTHITTDMVAGGAQIVAYTTGGGNPVGSALAPVIKVTATPATVEAMAENMDFDASPVLLGEESLEDCGERLFGLLIEVANGKLTRAEALDHGLFAIGQVAVA